MQRRICSFSGNVQGVGFRYTAQRLAVRFNVQGYVRNLADGRVELVMEGAQTEMDGLLAAIRERMGDYIDDVDVRAAPATGEFGQFQIRH